MDAARWKKIKEIAGEAMDRPAADRPAYVAAACAGDAELAAEVESLLEHDRDASGFPDSAALLMERDDDALAGQALGPYRLLEEIGHGGMGTVFLAERVDGAYRQQVAVKVIRRGMDTEHVLRRFRIERQILATLNHPNIARLLDGGALPDGRPYLVMEHVSARRIDRYCDEEQLGVADRLRLFLQVCDAVSFAHQRLVVHRDIKPGNVLVDASGTPKLLDFGIAKLLGPDVDGDAPVTESVLRPMTPDYASPEQIAGQPVTTTTDVYALGVLLYELLTGRRPHATKERTTQAVLEAISKTDPLRPSAVAPDSVRRRLEGDLDVILLTALRREPERRYASVEAFAADLRRHLEGRPVVARKDSWSYRTGRFLSRNAVPVSAAALAAAALVTGTLVATSQARVARAERAVAEKRQQDTLRLTNAMLFELFEGIDQGPTRARHMLVASALGYLDQSAREAPDDPDLLHELATAYTRLGNLQSAGRGATGAGGDLKQGRASFMRALRLRERIAKIAPAHFENRRQMGFVHVELGSLSSIEGRPEAGVIELGKGLALFERAAAERPRDLETRRGLAHAHHNLASALGSSDSVANVGRPSEAAPHLIEAVRIGEGLLAERPDDERMRSFIIALYNETAMCMDKLGRREAASDAQVKAIRAAESLVERNPDSLHFRRELAVGYGNRASRVLADDPAQALEYTRKALQMYESIAQSLPGDADAQRDLAIGYRNVGKSLIGTGDPQSAIPHLRRALELMKDVVNRSPDSAFLARQLAFTHLVMADALAAADEPGRSLAEVEKGIRIGEALVKKDASNMVALRTLAMSYAQAGRSTEALAKREPARWRAARAWYVRSRDAWSSLEQKGEIASSAKQVQQVHEAIARCDAAMASRAL